jgi:hypothetical protein
MEIARNVAEVYDLYIKDFKIYEMDYLYSLIEIQEPVCIEVGELIIVD